MDAPAGAGVDALVANARALAAGGRGEDALRSWQRVLELDPGHAEAAFHVGSARVHGGDPRGGRELLTRAAAGAPREPLVWLRIAIACRQLADPAGELAALAQALTIEPRLLPALLQKGFLLQRLERKREAAQAFAAALAVAPPESQRTPELARLLEQARDYVAADRAVLERLIDARLAGLDASSRRFAAAKDALLGRGRVYVQQPNLLHFPELPAVQFHPREQFPWIARLEAQTDAIRAELLQVLAESRAEFRPYLDHPPDVPLHALAELNRSPRWSSYFLWRNGAPVEAHLAKCPRTAAALAELPTADIPGAAPVAMFSALEPHTRIGAHTGETNVRLIVHLPLIVPEGCAFRVGSETRPWRVGEAFVFDDTIEHEAWNDSDELRVVLIFDVWNPHVTEAERALLRPLFAAHREHHGGDFG